jgi:hypothetical protein
MSSRSSEKPTATTVGVEAPFVTRPRKQDASGTEPSRAIRRILLTAAWLGALVTLAAWVHLGWPWALGFVGGALIGGGNLILLTALAHELLTREKRIPLRIAMLVGAKLIILYGGLAALLLWKLPPVLSVLAGFSLVLIVAVLKAGGQILNPGAAPPRGGLQS